MALPAAWPAQDGSGQGIERQHTIHTTVFHGFAGHAIDDATGLVLRQRIAACVVHFLQPTASLRKTG